ncbi:MAG: heme-binding protein [Pseudomonadota bacterium]
MLAALLSAGCSVFGGSGVEEAPYETLVQDGDFEIRRYPSLVVARTAMPPGDNGAAFGVLFDYITGANQGARKIEMTAPVVMGRGSDVAMTAPVVMDADTMAFIAPQDFTLDTMPAPTDARVEIGEIPGRTLAVARFSGYLFDSWIADEERKLRAWLETQPWSPSGPRERAGYNPPWTLPFLRRNEVLIPVAAEN